MYQAAEDVFHVFLQSVERHFHKFSAAEHLEPVLTAVHLKPTSAVLQIS